MEEHERKQLNQTQPSTTTANKQADAALKQSMDDHTKNRTSKTGNERGATTHQQGQTAPTTPGQAEGGMAQDRPTGSITAPTTPGQAEGDLDTVENDLDRNHEPGKGSSQIANKNQQTNTTPPPPTKGTSGGPLHQK